MSQFTTQCRKVMLALALVWCAPTAPAPAQDLCRVEVVDASCGWPVPLVELRTVSGLRFVTDNAGVVALDAPELMGRETYFFITGHGYGVAADGFGFRGVRIVPKPGETIRIRVDRTNIARRLGRLTGSGRFAESQRLGDDTPDDEQPTAGQDSVQLATFGDRLFWLWGDTSLQHYPLGVFDATAATTSRTPLARFEPPIHLDYSYFADALTGRPRGVAPIAGDGPTWLTGMTTLPDAEGRERLVAMYMKIRGFLHAYERGLCVWDDGRGQFVRERIVWAEDKQTDPPAALPDGQAARWTDERGTEWVLFGNPFPTLRCEARFEAWRDPSAWQRLAAPASLRSAEGEEVLPHTGSIAWNAHRNRWITVFVQRNGKPSALGEVWYAEAASPFGPWGPAVKILTHENYSFYNPRIDHELTAADDPFIVFEGTYTATFADSPNPTPRYDYNQVLYRLDLDDPALTPARQVRHEARQADRGQAPR